MNHIDKWNHFMPSNTFRKNIVEWNIFMAIEQEPNDKIPNAYLKDGVCKLAVSFA